MHLTLAGWLEKLTCAVRAEGCCWIWLITEHGGRHRYLRSRAIGDCQISSRLIEVGKSYFDPVRSAVAGKLTLEWPATRAGISRELGHLASVQLSS